MTTSLDALSKIETTVAETTANQLESVLGLAHRYAQELALHARPEAADRIVKRIRKCLRPRRMGRVRKVAFVATQSNEAVGFVCARFHKRKPVTGCIDDIYVCPAQRRRGIATDLLNHARCWLQGQGVERIVADILIGRMGAQEFFAENGLHPVATRVCSDRIRRGQ